MRNRLLTVLRSLGLMPLIDRLRMEYFRIKNRKKNKEFKRQNPNIALPPDSVMYETFKLDYYKYYNDGKSVAQQIKQWILEYQQTQHTSILDWGCGPGRVVRHLPKLLTEAIEVCATDFNRDAILWCKKNIRGVSFFHNDLYPPTSLPQEKFGFIYGISVMTHMSAENQQLWLKELCRLLAPLGILILTTQGDAFISKLNAAEHKQYRNGEIIVRASGPEGKRTYSAFHPPTCIPELVAPLKVISHIHSPKNNGRPDQDIWILRK